MSVKNPNISGIIHNIILLVDACRASAEGIVVIFCMTHMDDPTRIGITNGDGSGCARSIHRNELLMGIMLCTWDSQLYKFPDNATRFSGLLGTV